MVKSALKDSGPTPNPYHYSPRADELRLFCHRIVAKVDRLRLRFRVRNCLHLAHLPRNLAPTLVPLDPIQ